MTSSTGSTPRSRMRHHLDNLAAAKDATPQERQEILESVRQEARDRRRTRPVPRWLASSTNRRALALLAAVPFTAGAVSAYLAPDSLATAAVQAAGAAGLLTGILVLRRATRELTEIPAADLDERELQERNQALGAAYVTLLACLLVVVLLAVADGRLFDIASWEPLLLGTLGTAVLLPSAAAAWKSRDLSEEA
ncbi:hypothetical protein [Actinopolymorpha alba]|uniref:hypothetical protein n=1 Tax=Actinopolymorpha alba TaxID=533267 RepID=UPI0012F6D2B7|nr:hypothetical protein [Actinopolymorpha alba]